MSTVCKCLCMWWTAYSDKMKIKFHLTFWFGAHEASRQNKVAQKVKLINHWYFCQFLFK
jgi:hypothetical protein